MIKNKNEKFYKPEKLLVRGRLADVRYDRVESNFVTMELTKESISDLTKKIEEIPIQEIREKKMIWLNRILKRNEQLFSFTTKFEIFVIGAKRPKKNDIVEVNIKLSCFSKVLCISPTTIRVL